MLCSLTAFSDGHRPARGGDNGAGNGGDGLELSGPIQISGSGFSSGPLGPTLDFNSATFIQPVNADQKTYCESLIRESALSRLKAFEDRGFGFHASDAQVDAVFSVQEWENCSGDNGLCIGIDHYTYACKITIRLTTDLFRIETAASDALDQTDADAYYRTHSFQNKSEMIIASQKNAAKRKKVIVTTLQIVQ